MDDSDSPPDETDAEEEEVGRRTNKPPHASRPGPAVRGAGTSGKECAQPRAKRASPPPSPYPGADSESPPDEPDTDDEQPNHKHPGLATRPTADAGWRLRKRRRAERESAYDFLRGAAPGPGGKQRKVRPASISHMPASREGKVGVEEHRLWSARAPRAQYERVPAAQPARCKFLPAPSGCTNPKCPFLHDRNPGARS